MTLDETIHTIQSFCGGTDFQNTPFLTLWQQQEERREQIVRQLKPSDIDHFFFLLLEDYLPEGGMVDDSEYGWNTEVISWLGLWTDIHPTIVDDKVAKLARDPQQWEPLIYIFREAADYGWLSWIDRVVDEATLSRKLDQELVDLVEQALDSVLEVNRACEAGFIEPDQVQSIRKRFVIWILSGQ
ncbi:MAG: hypothetical protein H7145_23215 [Akkermansiaceae bacterium]|nr:hypothetical protein [Armatimonadota bacterium]